MNKRIIPMVAAVAAVGAAALIWTKAGGGASGNGETSLPAGVDIKALVQSYSTGQLQADSASISSTQLVVTKTDRSTETYKLPEDEFFVSIAPYRQETHPCETHNLTGCQGEMTDEEFQVTVTDSAGATVVDRSMASGKNGFIDLWLPRDAKYHVKLEHDGHRAESDLSTFENDNTCVTTMQLQ